MRRTRQLLTSILVGVGVWGLSEHLYPQAFPSATTGQRFFWGLVIVILVTIVAESVQLLFRIERRVDAISVFFKALTDSKVETAFKDIYKWYYTDFKEMRGWVNKAILNFRDEMASGYISMIPIAARNDMAEMYRTAKEWVVVTNVGGLEFFLENTAYQDLNRETFNRGIPVIRFFLYGSPANKSSQEDALSELRSKAKESMKKMFTVCGILIAAQEVSTSVPGLPGPEDFLLVDNSFVAHAELDPMSWDIRRIKATIRPDKIRQYCQYLHELQGIGSKEVICLDEINDSDFNGKAFLEKKMGKRTGQRIFKDIMDEVGRTGNP